MSLRSQKLGWIGAIAVGVVTPAGFGFVHGFFDGLFGPTNIYGEIFAMGVGIPLGVFLVMGTKSLLQRFGLLKAD